MKKNSLPIGSFGFTLIELMVVVAIIGILMAAGIIAFSGAQRNARDAKRRADVDAISKALEQYYTSNNTYAFYAESSNTVWWNSGIGGYAAYMPAGVFPVDPLNDATYFYLLRAIEQNRVGAVNPQTRYCVTARLETANGNCTGSQGTVLGSMTSFQCNFTTPGTGTHYCAQNRQ